MDKSSSGLGRVEDDEAKHLARQHLSSNSISYLTDYEQRPPVYPEFDSKFDLNDYCYADADYEPSARHPDPTSSIIPEDSNETIQNLSRILPSYSVSSNNTAFPHGAYNHDGISGATCAIQPHMVPSPYNPPQPHFLEIAGDNDHTANSAYQPRNRSQRKNDPHSKYGPYTGQFESTESASQYRKQATRFNRKPYRPPDTDGTIAEVERDRMYHVEQIYNAMTRGDAARDNKGSIAMKRWVHGAYYKSDLVEAYSHKVLDCLLLQAKEGFRGWVHNDYVADDRKGEDEDRDVTCEERLESILRALEEEKTICEDVMNSACQIRMFVNAPKAYANRKYQNRVGNSKRGKPKDFDVSEPPPKVRKAMSRPIARTRRRTDSNVVTEPDLLAQLQGQAIASAMQQTDMRFSTPPPYPGRSGFWIPPYTTNHNQVQGTQHIYGTSPPGMTPPTARQLHTMPPQQHTPLMSTPVLSYGNHSAPPSPEDRHAAYDQGAGFWPPVHPYEPSFGDAPLFDESWSGRQHGHIQTGPSANLFAARPEAAKEVLNPRTHGSPTENDSSEYWDHRHGVPPLSNAQETRFEDKSSIPQG